MSCRYRAFTLIELLVVITIIAILAGMVAVLPQASDEDLVGRAARELAATCYKTRNLAIRTNRAHAVNFNIDMAGTGRLLRNHLASDPPSTLGRHSYHILEGRPALVGRQSDLPTYEAAVRKRRLGEIIHLPRGVRFLALTDYDFSAASNRYTTNCVDQIYPIPWFGVLRPGQMETYEPPADIDHYKLYPWGAYWQEEAGGSGTGFNYQGWTYGSYASGANIERGSGPLVNSDWQDCYVLFTPSGGALSDFLLNSRNRWQYNPDTDGNGIIGLQAQFWWRQYNDQGFDDMNRHPFWHCARGMQHDLRNTGGYHITLCREVDEDEDIYPEPGRFNVFASIADAERSVTPLRRVFIDRRSGEVSIRDEEHPLCELRMNQRNLALEDIGIDKTNVYMVRPAHRHGNHADDLVPSLQDADSTDQQWDEDGWMGWYPEFTQ